jgi:methylmalonyl-CoA mutase C-terminal domain/subunit
VSFPTVSSQSRPRILLAKTGLDGHWRGLSLVARALRESGFEVILSGMAVDKAIARAAVDEDVDLLGLNVGGSVEVVERILDAVWAACPGLPVFAGGAIPPWACRRLEARGIEVYPPGSALSTIVAAAERLTGTAPAQMPSRAVPG